MRTGYIVVMPTAFDASISIIPVESVDAFCDDEGGYLLRSARYEAIAVYSSAPQFNSRAASFLGANRFEGIPEHIAYMDLVVFCSRGAPLSHRDAQDIKVLYDDDNASRCKKKRKFILR